jgi:hypothetical protein
MNIASPIRPSAIGLLLALIITTACSSGSGSKATAPPPTASTSSSGSTATSPGAGPSTTASGQACRHTTVGTAAGGGDVLVPGDIPDTQHFVTYHSGDGYRIDYPEGWAQMQSGLTVTFTDKFNSVRVESASAPDAPSVASAESTDVAALATSAACFQAGKVSQVTRKAGSAVKITYRADSAPDSVTGKSVVEDVERYEFWRAGKLITITLSSPKGSDNVDPWRTVTDSFTWGQ